MLAEYRRYRHYLNDNFSDPERLRFAGLRQLLVLQALVLTIGLVFTVLNAYFDFSYDVSWYFFALRGVLIYGLIVVGIQANYAAATSPLRLGASAIVGPDEPMASVALPRPSPPIPAVVLPLHKPAPRRTDAVESLGAALPPPTELTPELLPWREKLLRLMADEQP